MAIHLSQEDRLQRPTKGKSEASKNTRDVIDHNSYASRVVPLRASELDMDWIHPWIGLDWIGSGF